MREPLLGRIRLQWWRDAVDDALAGRPARHPAIEALARGTAHRALDPALLHRLFDARAQDFEQAPPERLDDLVGYARDTSAALAVLGLQALGCDDGEDEEDGAGGAARRAAEDVGVAWALIGLVRAVPFDVRHGLSRLPVDLLAAAGLDPHRVTQSNGARLAPAVEAVAETALAHLAAARRLRRAVPKAALPVLLLATLADGYLAGLNRCRFDPFAPGLQTRPPGRLLRLAANKIRGRY
jgi:phytoene synthase